MLKRIDWVRDCGFFEDYRWSSELPALARINVIYGSNGTGKTSLAGAFDGLRNPSDAEGFRRLSLTIDDGEERTTDGRDDPLFDRILVFSEHYVTRSHNFSAGSADMPAVLTIGEKPVEAERKLEELREELEKKLAEREKQAGYESDAVRALNETYGAVSQQVVDAASRAGGRWHSRSNFNVGVVRKVFAESHAEWELLTDQDLDDKIGLINSDKAEGIPEDQLIVTVPNELSERLASALSTTPTSVILDTLESNPSATSWVDEGRHLHEVSERCIFCGSPFTEARRNLIRLFRI